MSPEDLFLNAGVLLKCLANGTPVGAEGGHGVLAFSAVANRVLLIFGLRPPWAGLRLTSSPGRRPAPHQQRNGFAPAAPTAPRVQTTPHNAYKLNSARTPVWSSLRLQQQSCRALIPQNQ